MCIAFGLRRNRFFALVHFENVSFLFAISSFVFSFRFDMSKETISKEERFINDWLSDPRFKDILFLAVLFSRRFYSKDC